MICQKALVLLAIIGVSFAESDADAESNPDAGAFYSPYRTYNSARGFPYRRAYYSPYAFRPRNIVAAPSHLTRNTYARPVPARVHHAKPVFAPAAPLASAFVKSEPYSVPAPAPVAAAPHLRAVPAVPHKPIINAPVQQVAPVVYENHPIPAAPVAPIAASSINQIVATQYHTQDEFGNVAYGYANPNSAKQETRDAHGNVQGAYSYIDDTGVPKHVAYVADHLGYRLTSTNALPVPHL